MASAITRSETGAKALLSVRGIHKKFGGTYALQNVSFDIRKGEVLALLGENGAGKSTLIKILAGLYSLDDGEIIFEGQPANRRIADLPIAFIHQDLGLVDWMTVAENVSLTRGFDRRFGVISWGRCRRIARKTLQQIGVDIDPDTRVRSLAAPNNRSSPSPAPSPPRPRSSLWTSRPRACRPTRWLACSMWCAPCAPKVSR